jgi:hypothetical protein
MGRQRKNYDLWQYIVNIPTTIDYEWTITNSQTVETSQVVKDKFVIAYKQ